MSSKLGIASLQDLYQATDDRHIDLKDILANTDASGEPLKKALADLFFTFQGIKGCCIDTAAAATMIHAATAS